MLKSILGFQSRSAVKTGNVLNGEGIPIIMQCHKNIIAYYKRNRIHFLVKRKILLIGYVYIKYYKFPTGQTVMKVVISSISYQHNTHYQPIMKMCIRRLLIVRESDNMVLVPCKFDPAYSVAEINSCHHLIAETSAQKDPFLYDSNHFSER